MVRILLVLAFSLVALPPVAAHHSFSAYYFEDQSVTIEGVVREFQFRSPHAILLVDARDEGGQMRTYAAEWGNPNRLSRQGIGRDTLRPGDAVVVTGSPGRTAGEYKLHLKQIQRPSDGWTSGIRRR